MRIRSTATATNGPTVGPVGGSGQSRAHGRRTSIWPTRRDLQGSYVHVDPDDDEMIEIVLPPDINRGTRTCVSIDRQEARMLARRINQCLDGTVKK